MTDDLHPYRTEPDPAFADRLERDLLRRLAAPSNSTNHDLPEDDQLVPLDEPDRPPVAGELYAPPALPRSHTGRWLAAAAVLVLVVAAVALLRNTGDDVDGPVDGVPTTTTMPPWTDTPSTGSIVTAEGQGWPEGAAAPPRPESVGPPEDAYSWSDFDPTTGSFLYTDYFFSSQVWVLGADGEEQADFACPISGGPNCGAAVFGPGPDEVTIPPPEETCPATDCIPGPVVPVLLQIISWDGTVRDTVDISAAFAREANGTTERTLAALAWSPDGSHLAVGTQGGERCNPYEVVEGRLVEVSPRPEVGDECGAEVWVFDRDGDDPQLVHTATPADPTDGDQRQPPVLAGLGWSPDGRSLAVSIATPPLGRPTWPQLIAFRFEPGEPVRADVLHVYDDVVATGTQLVYEEDYTRFTFAWSPDGTRIAVTGSDSVVEISADDGRILARHPGSGGNGVAGDAIAWLPGR
jgi:hypothetical protein